MQKKIKILLSIFLLGHFLDVLITFFGIKLIGIHLEFNPINRFLINELGYGIWLIIQIGIIILLLKLFYNKLHLYPKILLSLSYSKIFVVLWNIYVLKVILNIS